MAVRYDQPLPDVERAVRHFRNYLLAQRKKYCRNAGENLTAGEIALEQRLQHELLHQSKSGRVLVPDISAVLGHICAMIHLEKLRESTYAEKLKKQQHAEIKDMVGKAGFNYSSESIQNVFANIPAKIKFLRARFVDR